MVVDIRVPRELSPTEAELVSRIDWFIRLRWVAIGGLLLTLGFVGLVFPGVLPLAPLLVIAASIAAYNLAFFIYARHLRQPQRDLAHRPNYYRFVNLQIVLDLVTLTVLLHLSGGIDNPFAFYYVFYVIIVSILLPQRAAFAYAGLVTLLFGGMVLLGYMGLCGADLSAITGMTRQHSLPYVASTFLAFASTVFLTTWMASGISLRLHERTIVHQATARSLEDRTQELSAVNAQLRQADRARADFVLVVTHELRAPLAAVQSLLGVILEGYAPDPAKQLDLLTRANARVSELLQLITNLLELSRMSQEGSVEQSELLDMGEVLQNIVDVMRIMAERKELMLSVDIEPHLPTVRASEGRLKEVWTNLISNAIKYTPSGGIVVVSVYQNPNYVVGSVRDTGIGIGPEEQARLFTPFFRTEEAKTLTKEGTGLGLAIVKRIVEHYGGRLWVESHPNQGSKFSFALPKVPPTAKSETGARS
ncbi:MAG: HAMP domain-containing histidine kinase [Chloroflexi bacterium]|nr:HAMP domain-containing histidine kinase [Chloroflexota bacterium]